MTEDLGYAGYHFPKEVNFIIKLTALAQGFENASTFGRDHWLSGNEGNVTHNL
jgi:hypothetical protein